MKRKQPDYKRQVLDSFPPCGMGVVVVVQDGKIKEAAGDPGGESRGHDEARGYSPSACVEITKPFRF